MDTQTQDRTDTSTAGVEMNPGDNTGQELATTGGAMTQAQYRKAKTKKILEALHAKAQSYTPLLDAHGIAWEVFIAIIQQALLKVPSLLDCTTESFLAACMKCATDGLMPDGDEASITPFKKIATYVPGYKGMLKCAYAMQDGMGAKVYRDVDVDVVYEGEEALISYQKGTDPWLKFAPPLNRDIEKPVVAAYAVVRTNNGGIYIELIGQKELRKIAGVNKSTNGPRAMWGAQMDMKGPLRRLLKRTPKDQRLVTMLRHDEDAYIDNAAQLVDGDAVDIPNAALFDDTRHVPADEGKVTPQDVAGTDDEASEIVLAMQSDLMATETEEALDKVIAKVKKTAKSKISDADRALVLDGAEKLRAHRWPKQEPDQSHQADLEEGEGFANEHGEAVLTEADEGFVQVGDTQIAPGETHELTEADKQVIIAARQAPQGGGTGAPSNPAADAERKLGTEVGKKTIGETIYEVAPADRRMTPQEAILADPEEGVHFIEGISQNASGQVPYFNGDEQIIGWAKPDLDIPTRAAGAAPKAAPVSSGSPAGNQSAQITSQPEDRQDPAQANQGDDDDGYGEEEEQATAGADSTPIYYVRVSPTKDPVQYTDAVEWRDAMLFKINALRADVGPRWWEDNRQYVIDAMPTAKPQAGRVAVVAVSKHWPGAKEIVDNFGPF